MFLRKITASTFWLFFSGFLLFYVEGWMPAGDIRWLILALVCALIATILNWPEIRAALFRRRNKPKKADSVAAVDYLAPRPLLMLT